MTSIERYKDSRHDVSFIVVDNKKMNIKESNGYDIPDFELRDNGIDLSSFNMIKYRFVTLKVSDENYDEVRTVLSDTVTEIYLKSNINYANYTIGRTLDTPSSKPRPVGFTGKRKTPDFIFKVGTEETAVEFKSTLFEATMEWKRARIREIQSKYSPEFKRIQAILITLSPNLPMDLGWGPNSAKFYKILRTAVANFRQGTDKVHKEESENNLLGNSMLRMGNSIPDSIIKTLEYKYDPFDFKQEKPYNQFLDSIGIVEPFFDSQYLDQSEAFNRVYSSFVFTNNIDGARPWDGKHNSVKYKSNFKHRALYLFKVPIHKSLNFDNFDLSTAVLDCIRHLSESAEEKFKSYGKMLYNICKAYASAEGELKKMRIQASKFAYLKSEYDKQRFDSTDTNVKEEFELIQKEYDDIFSRLEEKNTAEYQFTKNGYVRYKLTKEESYFLGINRNVNKYNKDKESGIDVDSELVDLEQYLHHLPRGNRFDVDVSGFYSNLPLNETADEMSNISLQNLNTVLLSKQAGYMMYYKKFCRAYCSIFPRDSKKQNQHNDFTLFSAPDLPCFFIATAPINEQTGVIVAFSQYKKNTPLDFKLPDAWIPHKYFRSGDHLYGVSKPFRLNMKLVANYEEFMCSFVSLSVLGISYKVNYYENPWFCSLYWEYSRSLSLCSDMIYLLMKNAMNYGSVGFFDYPKKFSSLMFWDVRVCHFVRMLKQHYKSYVENVKNYVKTMNYDPFTKTDPAITPCKVADIWDPLFNVTHKYLQSMLITMYIKQIFPKDDGFDDKYLHTGFILDEQEFQRDYEQSYFYNKKNTPKEQTIQYYTHMDLGDYFNKVVLPDSKWTPISYHPGSCYFGTKLICRSLKKKNASFFDMNNFINHNYLNTGKQSKVLIPESLLPEGLNKASKYKELIEGAEQFRYQNEQQKRDAEKMFSKFKGLQSILLTEALVCTDRKFKDLMKSVKNADSEDGMSDYEKAIRSKVFFLSDLEIEEYTTKLADIVEFAFFKLSKKVVVSTCVKLQKGYSKRMFFIQTVMKRDLHKFLDESLTNLLSNYKYDMIAKSGDEKNMALEHSFSFLNASINDCTYTTEDATKFGDLYHLDAFRSMIHALYDEGYYSLSQCKLWFDSLLELERRAILLPPELLKFREKNKNKLEERYPHGTPKGDKFWEYFDKLQGLRDIRAWTSVENIQEGFVDNPALLKEVGFVLGVFNKLGSVLSAAQLAITEKFFNFIGLKNKFHGRSHSDDYIKAYLLSISKHVNMNQFSIKNLIAVLREGYKIDIEVGSHKVKFYKINKKTTQGADGSDQIIKIREYKELTLNEDITVNHVAKLIAILSLMIPRLIGQRQSLTKWGIGPTGEVLQTFAIKGKMIPPLMRYVSAIGADLPGKSPANDLYAMVGRCYQVFASGGDMQLVSDLMIISNWYVYDRFGYSSKDLVEVTDKLPELDGFVWFFPPLLLEHGFLANEYRLLAKSRMGNTFIKDQFLIMGDTSDFFYQSSTMADKVKVADLNTGDNVGLNMESNNNESTLMDGSLISRKDFFIRYKRNIKALYSFKILSEAYRPQINDYIQSIIDNNEYPEEKLLVLKKLLNEPRNNKVIKGLMSELADRLVGKLGRNMDQIIIFLNRYLNKNFQEAYLRVPEGAMLISRLGYQERQFPDPFNEKFYNNFHFEKTGDKYTRKEIINKIITACKSNFNIQGLNSRVYSFTISLREREIRETATLSFGKVEENLKKTDINKELSFSWFRVNLKVNPFDIDINLKAVLAAYVQMDVYKEDDISKLPISQIVPELMFVYNVDQVYRIINLIKGFRIKVRDVINNPTAVINLLETRSFVGVVRGIAADNLMRSFMIFNYRSDQFWLGNIRHGEFKENDDFTATIIDSEAQEIMKSDVAWRLLFLTFNMVQVNDIDPKRVIYKKSQIETNFEKVISSVKNPLDEQLIHTRENLDRIILYNLLTKKGVISNLIFGYKRTRSEEIVEVSITHRFVYYSCTAVVNLATQKKECIKIYTDTNNSNILDMMLYIMTECVLLRFANKKLSEYIEENRLSNRNGFLFEPRGDKEYLVPVQNPTQWILNYGNDYNKIVNQYNVNISTAHTDGIRLFLFKRTNKTIRAASKKALVEDSSVGVVDSGEVEFPDRSDWVVNDDGDIYRLIQPWNVHGRYSSWTLGDIGNPDFTYFDGPREEFNNWNIVNLPIVSETEGEYYSLEPKDSMRGMIVFLYNLMCKKYNTGEIIVDRGFFSDRQVIYLYEFLQLFGMSNMFKFENSELENWDIGDPEDNSSREVWRLLISTVYQDNYDLNSNDEQLRLEEENRVKKILSKLKRVFMCLYWGTPNIDMNSNPKASILVTGFQNEEFSSSWSEIYKYLGNKITGNPARDRHYQSLIKSNKLNDYWFTSYKKIALGSRHMFVNNLYITRSIIANSAYFIVKKRIKLLSNSCINANLKLLWMLTLSDRDGYARKFVSSLITVYDK